MRVTVARSTPTIVASSALLGDDQLGGRLFVFPGAREPLKTASLVLGMRTSAGSPIEVT
jgi:hypothetical protein